jgi:hypothetical protein
MQQQLPSAGQSDFEKQQGWLVPECSISICSVPPAQALNCTCMWQAEGSTSVLCKDLVVL